jgi:uncharacterized protein YdbL (DUF1318 family)
MTRTEFLAVVFGGLLSPRTTLAQRGTAESGYWPMGYNGDTWTGEVVAVNDDTREVTLRYTKGKKTQTFIGELVPGYKVRLKDGSTRELRVSEIGLGRRIKVYYMERTRMVNGKKSKYCEIFRMTNAPQD